MVVAEQPMEAETVLMGARFPGNQIPATDLPLPRSDVVNCLFPSPVHLSSVNGVA